MYMVEITFGTTFTYPLYFFNLILPFKKEMLTVTIVGTWQTVEKNKIWKTGINRSYNLHMITRQFNKWDLLVPLLFCYISYFPSPFPLIRLWCCRALQKAVRWLRCYSGTKGEGDTLAQAGWLDPGTAGWCQGGRGRCTSLPRLSHRGKR